MRRAQEPWVQICAVRHSPDGLFAPSTVHCTVYSADVSQTSGRRRGDVWETSGSRLGVVWEWSGSGLGDVWESSGSRPGVVRESSGSRLGVVWESSGRHLGDGNGLGEIRWHLPQNR